MANDNMICRRRQAGAAEGRITLCAVQAGFDNSQAQEWAKPTVAPLCRAISGALQTGMRFYKIFKKPLQAGTAYCTGV